jgi:hypothetical protein
MLIVGGLIDGAMLIKNVRGKENDNSHPIPSLPYLAFREAKSYNLLHRLVVPTMAGNGFKTAFIKIQGHGSIQRLPKAKCLCYQYSL